MSFWGNQHTLQTRCERLRLISSNKQSSSFAFIPVQCEFDKTLFKLPVPNREIRHVDAAPFPRFADNTSISSRLCWSNQAPSNAVLGITRHDPVSLPNHNRPFSSQFNYLEHQRKQAAKMKAFIPKDNILWLGKYTIQEQQQRGHFQTLPAIASPTPPNIQNKRCLQENTSQKRENQKLPAQPSLEIKSKTDAA